MSRTVIILARPIDRERAATLCFKAEPMTVVELREPARSREANARMWAMLTRISKELNWHGQKYPPEAWRDWFMHYHVGESWMPAEDGQGMVPVGRSTAPLKVDQHRALCQRIQDFAARHGVEL